ncbi:Inositol monophosphatase QutG [Aspergillus sclerotialis]|uniref:Inositol monophosphatase QutG n=1 Tax=Aspergillus sclerotialis TaxID=2070753 RepID=A0A3A2Z872_9EURO|nr:Inositol monophosphatase QutG [Aspergillus sclerotialis]
MSSLSQAELDDIYAFAVGLGRTAGNLLLDGVEKRINGGNQSVEEKDSSVDIVTKTDEGLYSSVNMRTGLMVL